MITPKELVGLLPPTFDPDYIDGAVVPYLLSSQSIGERPVVPLIDLALSKENAAPPHFWGMLYDGWAPNPEEEGVTVFIQGYEHRGPDNERKKIYASATTPDLYAAKYAGKFRRFLSRLFDDTQALRDLHLESLVDDPGGDSADRCQRPRLPVPDPDIVRELRGRAAAGMGGSTVAPGAARCPGSG
jgi:hypothetical protein